MSAGTLRWNNEQLAAHNARLGRQTPPPAPVAAKPAVTSGKARMQAKGRLKDGEMNATEARYAAHLDTLKAAGDVLWWAFEAVKLKLAPNTHLTVDFFVLLADGSLEAHDVKGARAIVQDDSKAKIKIAADRFPWPFRLVFPRAKQDGGGWDVEAV